MSAERKSFKSFERCCSTTAFRLLPRCGLGGVGKTQVANALAHWTKKNKPEYTVLWVPAISKASFEEAYVAIGEKVGIRATEEQPDVQKLVCGHLSDDATGPWLLVVDNADDFKLICGLSDSLDRYLPRNGNVRMLITTRTLPVSQQLADETVDLKEFGLSDARVLAKRLLGSKWTNLVGDDESSSMDEMLGELECLPLAITQATAYIKTNNKPVTRYLELLRGTDASRVDLLSKEIPDNTR